MVKSSNHNAISLAWRRRHVSIAACRTIITTIITMNSILNAIRADTRILTQAMFTQAMLIQAMRTQATRMPAPVQKAGRLRLV
jgi:hypothetical protein